MHLLRLGGHASRAIRSHALRQAPRSSVKNRRPCQNHFVGAAAAGDEIGIKEDKGFAINPWTAVRFENSKTILNADSATAMGEYYFTTLEGTVAKVEYTFQYKRGADGNLKIVVHHSSLPYSP